MVLPAPKRSRIGNDEKTTKSEYEDTDRVFSEIASKDGPLERSMILSIKEELKARSFQRSIDVLEGKEQAHVHPLEVILDKLLRDTHTLTKISMEMQLEKSFKSNEEVAYNYWLLESKKLVTNQS